MDRLNLNGGLYGRLRQQAGTDWQHYVRHPFVCQLASGQLSPVAFRHYLIQDYLFLIQFARAYALLASKLRHIDHIRSASNSLAAIVAELPLHVSYCADWGLSEADMAAQPEAPQTLNYTRYVLDIGHAGDGLDLLVALMPCVAGYAEIGLRLLNDPHTVMAGNPYAAWLRNYSAAEYLRGVQASLDLLEQLADARGAAVRLASLAEIFTTATRLESAFWQMGLDAASVTAPGNTQAGR